MKPTTLAGRGDCMLAAWHLVMAIDAEHLRDVPLLCHAVVHGTGAMAGETFWHAWVEHNGMALDWSNGRRAVVAAETMYRIAKVNPVQVRRYTAAEARAEGARYGIVGPWPPVTEAAT